jgi:hydroxymethylpyrimidine pyrophosphatase-like HAD family hydrolase
MVPNPMKKLVIFDLDGTLAESKSSLDDEMASLLSSLLRIVKVAVISGGTGRNSRNNCSTISLVTRT